MVNEATLRRYRKGDEFQDKIMVALSASGFSCSVVGAGCASKEERQEIYIDDPDNPDNILKRYFPDIKIWKPGKVPWLVEVKVAPFGQFNYHSYKVCMSLVSDGNTVIFVSELSGVGIVWDFIQNIPIKDAKEHQDWLMRAGLRKRAYTIRDNVFFPRESPWWTAKFGVTVGASGNPFYVVIKNNMRPLATLMDEYDGRYIKRG